MKLTINYRHDQESDLPELQDIMQREAIDEHISTRTAYFYLTNIDEFPEMLPLAYRIATDAIAATAGASEKMADTLPGHQAGTDPVAALSASLASLSEGFAHSALDQHEETGRQLAPLLLNTGCWLQNLSRVATAHSHVAAELTHLFSLHTMAYNPDNTLHSNQAECNPATLFSLHHDLTRTNHYLSDNKRAEFAFRLPLLLTSLGQFPRQFLPEILGLNLAWHEFGIQAFLESNTLGKLATDSSLHASVEILSDRHADMRDHAIKAISIFCEEVDEHQLESIWERILNGSRLLASAWHDWLDAAEQNRVASSADAHTAMLELIRNKSEHARGYHRSKQLGEEQIDQLLDTDHFEPAEVLAYLARSPYVKPGMAAKSSLVSGLVNLGGPMVGVFSGDELRIVSAWIDSLPVDDSGATPSKRSNDTISVSGTTSTATYPGWNRSDYMQEVISEYAGRPCSVREIYYKLVNIEFFPDILPIAERFLRDRLTWSQQTLLTGERPIPQASYSYEVLQQWVFNKHREQVDAYTPFEQQPPVPRDLFIQSTTGLAPLLLIDGAWLQGITGMNTIQSPLGRELFHIFFEEVGFGSAKLHHANIYRELLESMGVNLPDVTEIDFAFSDAFRDDAFRVPVLWLAISCFTRHYMPEILGLNLAVEMAGLGSSYLEAHDVLKHYGYSTLFVDLHNSADNVSVGHTAWALEAINTYMNTIMEQEGPHALDAHWQRIWSGMRLTLPDSSDYYWGSTGMRSADLLPGPIFH